MFSPFAASTPSRIAARVLSLAFCAWMAPSAMALESSRVAGGWDMSLDDTNRRCSLVLRDEPADQGLALGLPAVCRRALPILTNVDAWKIEGEQVGFADRDGETVLSFAALRRDLFVARGPEGETYQLAQAQTDGGFRQNPSANRPATAAPKPQPLPAAPATTAQAAPLTRGQAPAAAPAAAQPNAPVIAPAVNTPVKQADMVGRYAILRDGNKDTLCMLTLESSARGPRGTLKAQLAPACRDQGVVVFEPMGWQLERNKLVLTARKGHKATFELTADGSWQKDPKEGGKPLGFRKM